MIAPVDGLVINEGIGESSGQIALSGSFVIASEAKQSSIFPRVTVWIASSLRSSQ
jgi:hypothetical protein